MVSTHSCNTRQVSSLDEIMSYRDTHDGLIQFQGGPEEGTLCYVSYAYDSFKTTFQDS